MTMTTATRRPSYGAPALALWPDEEDLELPLDEELPAYDVKVEAADLAAHAYKLEQEREQLRRALVDALAHVEAGTAPHGSRIRAWRDLAGTTYADNLTPTERAEDGIARAAARWTAEEAAAVDTAIRTVAERRIVEDGLGIAAREFTTADVWQELDGTVPVTKGIAGRMTAAKSAGIIANTGRTIIAPREATGPNHGQRLTVWRAL